MARAYLPQYSVDEQEFSESDCPSEGQAVQQALPPRPPDFMELYRRKHQSSQAHNTGPYCHGHLSGYYEPQSRLATTCPCNLPPDPRYYYCKAPPGLESAYRSSPQHAGPNLVTCQDVAMPKSPAVAVKKYPITARTPRYYKCPVAPPQKRPSTLCLPVTSQPDPAAICNRQRKDSQAYRSQEGTYAINNYFMKTAFKKTEVRQVDSEGDLNSRLNDLESLLTKFDNGEEPEEGREGEPVQISGVNELTKILKPKVPSSIKAKHQDNDRSRAKSSRHPDEPLDLANKEKTCKKKESEDVEEVPSRSSDEKILDAMSDRRSRFLLEQKPALDDNSALELHKSKSYIVSLIDNALSKELGTVPGNKCSRKDFIAMNPKKAIDLLNRHTGSVHKPPMMSLPITPSSAPTKSKQCGCKVEEPLYLKQLKELRWSHLRHIQREAKRLADLERFLDSFGESDNPQ